jgi:hypothetical protein
VVQFLRSYYIELILMGILLAAVIFFAYLGYGLLSPQLAIKEFSGDEAYVHVESQVAAGPRTTGSEASRATVDWFTEALRREGWRVVIQPYGVTVPAIGVTGSITGTAETPAEMTALAATFSLSDMVALEARNLIAIREPAGADEEERPPVALVVAPYDSRIIADVDQSPEPSPGANVGASGAAVLLELARTLNVDLSEHRVCLVFLDGEANRGVPGWQPPYGGDLFLAEIGDEDEDLTECADPRLAVVLEAVGGQNHRLQIDPASDAALSNALWRTAAGSEFADQFVSGTGQPLPGAHNTFIDAGIPTVTIIEQGYPYRYTSEDTLDKVDANSLMGVGYTLQLWLESGAPALE